MTVPAQPQSKAPGSIPVDQSRSNVVTIEALGRQPIVSQIKPREVAAHRNELHSSFCARGTNWFVEPVAPASRT